MPDLTRQIVRRISDDDARLTEIERREWTGPVRGCGVIRTTAATIPNITLTTLAYSTAMFDLGACWSPAVSTHLIAPRAGYYIIEANVGWNNAADADGQRQLQIRDQDNKALAVTSQHGSSDTYVGQHLSTGPVHMAAADYAVIKVYQSSGAAMLISTASAVNQYLNRASIIRMH